MRTHPFPFKFANACKDEQRVSPSNMLGWVAGGSLQRQVCRPSADATAGAANIHTVAIQLSRTFQQSGSLQNFKPLAEIQSSMTHK